MAANMGNMARQLIRKSASNTYNKASLIIQSHVINHFNIDNGLEPMQPWLSIGPHASNTRQKPRSPGRSRLYIALGGSYHINSSLPYLILQFTKVSLQVRLGPRPPSPDSKFLRSPFDRIPGSPHCSALSEMVGSLHSDSFELIPEPGTAIEILIIARSFKLRVGPAFLQLYPADRVPNLVWVFYVTWIDGVAEKRGVGQTLESSFEDAVDPQRVAKKRNN
jgi:hypothetical protein